MGQYALAAAAGFLAGTAGAMGLGGGSILLLYLTLAAHTEQLTAQGMNLLFFIPCAVLALWLHSRQGRVPWREVLPAAAIGLPFAAAGYAASGFLGGDGMRKLFGLFLLALGVRELFGRETSGDAVHAPHGVEKKPDVRRIDSE